ncbi:hypothetical protein [Solirubrobacter soli]|uniref:hypothetical protein n=1 Tax=Solirubrobacter soli TaxID=363832 RepID=UPI000483C530|nr:hypothetical protein [Solirubrobacter soli]
MPWTSLSASLGDKPLVLAGPVLRKVVPGSVTVWLALKQAASVTLTVVEGTTQRMQGTRHTVAIGTNLHLVAVTATGTALLPGTVYEYDLSFAVDGGPQKTLADATNKANLAYDPFKRPSFCLPPPNLDDLRLIHSSCRMPHGNGVDVLPLVGQLISQTAQTPQQRPHQLLLMGDQIYADDVGASLLLLLTDASDVLLGWQETMPAPAGKANQLPPHTRRKLLDSCGFTSEDLDAHLMALGEYLAMYLFVWSDVLWGAAGVPTYEDVVAKLPAGTKPPDRKSIDGHIGNLKSFATGLDEVRRVLANVPSYMICDDHEVTDDWNMTLDIAVGLYGNAVGRRVVKNGVVAYTLCQHWGNAPEQFTDPNQPGSKLLALLDKGDATRYETNSAALDSLTSVHTGDQIKARKAVFHDPGSLIFNFTVEGPGHQVIFTDTRTWRSFPLGGSEAPDLLPPEQIAAQISQIQPPTAGRALIVVLTTNAPPVEPIRSATRHEWITNHVSHFPDVHEAWDLPSTAFDRLIKALSDRLPTVAGELRGPVILLSGDVHFGFASRMLYKAAKRFEDTGTKPATAVVAQLVSSSLRKQTQSTLDLGTQGYTYAPKWFIKPLMGPHETEYYAGWNVPPGAVVKAVRIQVTGPKFVDMSLRKSGTLKLEPAFRPKTVPDHIYQLDYLLTTKGASTPQAPAPLPALPSGGTPDQRKQALQAFNVATGNYRQYNTDSAFTREIVGVNNVGEVTFEWPDGDRKKVIHTVRWIDPRSNQLRFVDYAVDLDPNSTAFPFRPDVFAVAT